MEDFGIEQVEEEDTEVAAYECMPIIEVDAEKRRLESDNTLGREVRARLQPHPSNSTPGGPNSSSAPLVQP